MNKIEIKNHLIPSGYETRVFFIDDKPLYEYFNEWFDSKDYKGYKLSYPDVLEITWTDNYVFEGEARFMRYVLEQNNAITPILSCPEDFDFSCVVIVADVIKHEDKVIWKRIGMVDHKYESFDEEKRSGILCIEEYTDEDWQLYGDNIALEKVDSPAWCEWISENWDEEIYRRLKNYCYKSYQDENHILWFKECNFTFNRSEYDEVIRSCYTE